MTLTIRARLVLLTFGLVFAALAASDAAGYLALRSFLYQRADERRTEVALPAAEQLLTLVGSPQAGQDPKLASFLEAQPNDIYLAMGSHDGTITIHHSATRNGVALGAPALPDSFPVAQQSADNASIGAARFETPATSDAPGYEVFRVVDSSGNWAIAAVSLSTVSDTIGQLLQIELVVSAAVLLAAGLASLILVRLGLRPLRGIEATAASIAEGSLDYRATDTDSRTEVGRLGRSFNAMLERLERAFRAREASEARLRRFVADASHELRTPIASIRGYAELYRRGAAERPADRDRAMHAIEQEAERMGFLVDDLLLLARLDEGRPLQLEPVDVAELARQAVEAARAIEPERSIELVAAGPAIACVDRTRIRQAIDNLLANVRAHTPAGTPAWVVVARRADGIEIEVRDAGPGMPSDVRAQAFDRFYRGDPSRSRDSGGAGLGLSVVRAIAEAHGGRASFEATAAGTSVIVDVPSADRPLGTA
jgi:two-component system OmpR family sensor kinase